MNRQFRTPISKVVQPDSIVVLIRIIYALTTGTFGRGYSFAMRQLERVIPDKKIKVRFGEDAFFCFSRLDFYWNRIVSRSYAYEPEIEHILFGLKDDEYVFLDCGANIGYWSVLVSSKTFGCKRAIAIEASLDTFPDLLENAALNENRFVCLNRAIFSHDDEVLSLVKAKHHSAHHIGPETGRAEDEVNSISIDGVLTHQDIPMRSKLVIKLDVEGQEINALKGATRALETEFLLIYEDHAKDLAHETTKYVIEELELSVFFIDENFEVRKINTLSELNELKSNKHVGYNFLACKEKSGFFKKFKSL